MRAQVRARILDIPHEWQEQVALMKWAHLHEGTEPRLEWLYHIPNGEKRDEATAAKLQRMGVKRGVADLFLPEPMPGMGEEDGWRPPYHGCYVELKRPTRGTLAPEQRDFRNHVQARGYAYYAAAGWVQAAHYLCWYLCRPDLARALEGAPHVRYLCPGSHH